jgi:nucleoside-diphosphate-sugar epimerase
MRKLIFGCGYLGRRVADRWVQQGDDVFAVTRSAERAAEFTSAGISPIIADVALPESLNQLPSAHTVLFAVGYDRTAEPSQRDVYVTGLKNVLNQLAGNVSRFLHISSTSVYGEQSGGDVDETTSCEPVTASGKVCLEAEQTVQQFFQNIEDETSSFNILRLAGLYGPGRLLRRLDQLKSGESIPRNPNAILNLIHVDDAVSAVLACEKNGRPKETYLISDDNPLTRREYYETLSRLANTSPPVFSEVTDQPSRAPGFNKRCQNKRMHDELQVELKYPTAEAGLKMCWETIE